MLRFSPYPRKKWFFFFILASTVLSTFLHARLALFAEDDAYIHMRIARHLWLFGEPYFNLQEPVMASTAPLWIVLTSPAALFGDAQPLAIALLNSLLIIGASCVWATLFKDLTGITSPFVRAGAGVIVFFSLLSSSIGLMETPLAIGMIGLGLCGVMRGKSWGMAMSVASIFVRPEGVIFTLVALLLRINKRTPLRLAEALSTLLVVGTLLSYQVGFYRGIYPHTAHAKEVIYTLSLSECIRILITNSYGRIAARQVAPYAVVFTIILFIASTFRDKKRYDRLTALADFFAGRSLSVVVLPGAIILLTYLLKHVLVFSWYSPLFLVPIHLGLFRVLLTRDLLVRLLALSLLLPFMASSAFALSAVWHRENSPLFESGSRAQQLRRIGTVLSLHIPSAHIAAPEIGALGFSFKGPIRDSMGLASPEALQFHPLSVPAQRPAGFLGAVPVALVERYRPDVIVALSAFLTEFMSAEVVTGYEAFHLSPVRDEDAKLLLDGTVFGSSEILVFIRKDMAQGWSIERFHQPPAPDEL